jgi:hypothetical protein
MKARTSLKRTGTALAVVLAGTVVGVAGAVAVAEQRRSDSTLDAYTADRTAIAEWADAQGLTGLSPASLNPSGASFGDHGAYARELEEIADWARSHGLSGLSPASLQPIDDEG